MQELNLEEIKKYFTTQPIDRAWLFGSFARGEAGPESDVDILVNFTKNKVIGMKYITIINDLEKKLKRTVDLVEEDSLLENLKPFVEKDRILIYERED